MVLKIIKKTFYIFLAFVLSCLVIHYFTENQRYKVVNQIFHDTHFQPENIYIEGSEIEYRNDMFDEFAFYDIPSAYIQYAIQNLLVPDTKDKIDNAKIIQDCSNVLTWDSTGENTIFKSNNNIQISQPILSIDQNTALIQITTNCGMLCGSCYLYLFKKENGKWKKIKTEMLWIS
jgi:hypothetical protein